MKKLLSYILVTVILAGALAAAIPAGAAKTVFSDVGADRWSEASIAYAVEKEYMKGVGGGLFDPEGSLTRAMVATVLWRREGEPKPDAASGFTDVPDGEWYTDAVAWTKETGVVKGLTMTTFGPDEYITREQLATMLFRFSSSAPVSVPERADLSPFADDEKVSDWADEPLEWAVEAGLLKGTDGNRLDPDGFATREQFAAIIERYDGSFKLTYNDPVLLSHYTEPDYPLVKDADFYVSPTGDDSADGSFDHPFRTWERARDAVRTLDKAGRNGITVAFMAGNYGPLSVELTSEDSGTPECPVTYCKYGDGDAVFDNGAELNFKDFKPLNENERSLFDEKAADKIKKLDISDVVPPGEYDLSYSVFSDTGMCTVARFPNKYADGTDQLINGAAETLSLTDIRLTSGLMIRRMQKYHDISDLKIYGNITFDWYKDTLSVGTYDPETHEMYISDYNTARSAEFTGGLRWDIQEDGSVVYKEDIRLCFLNVSEELDAAGEYWVDPETSVIYVYDPGENYHMVVKDKMITMERANDITFRGLTFLNTRDYVIDGRLCHGITVDLCRMRCIGGTYAVRFVSHEADRDLDFTMTGCDCSLANDCFIYLSGYGGVSESVAFATHMNALIDNNSFRDYGLYLNEESGILLWECDEVKVSHNEFINSGRGAVHYGHSQNVTIEYNYAANQMINAEDGGVFSTWDSFYQRGNTVRYNVIANVSSQGVGGFGLYLDDWSAGNDVYSNLFFDCHGSVVTVHNGRDNLMRDNAVVNRGDGPADFVVTLSGMYRSDPPGTPDSEDLEMIGRWTALYEKYDSDPAQKAY
ncbi:MAG: S-layer homology domain-containing protein, partial [Clostridia bacterium]|nr:S-layer homology domain-containing protein [Clostridia bacterium]